MRKTKTQTLVDKINTKNGLVHPDIGYLLYQSNGNYPGEPRKLYAIVNNGGGVVFLAGGVHKMINYLNLIANGKLNDTAIDKIIKGEIAL